MYKEENMKSVHEEMHIVRLM